MTKWILNKNDLRFQEKQIDYHLEADDNLYVDGDPNFIDQVITNYISNAINHTPVGGHVAILIQREEDRVCFTIRNSGSHIPEDQISRLWESFYKVDKARTREYGGQGLGLYIVKTMMDLHQGGYGARNVEGGVEFWFTLAAVPVPIDDWEDDYDEEPFGEEPPVETLEDSPFEEHAASGTVRRLRQRNATNNRTTGGFCHRRASTSRTSGRFQHQ